MTAQLAFSQLLNGLQLGVLLFLLAAGLTLVFGIMSFVNLAHGSLYMVGAYLAAAVSMATGSYWLAVPVAMAGTAAIGPSSAPFSRPAASCSSTAPSPPSSTTRT